VVPISFGIKYPIGIKIAIGFLGFLYVLYVLLKVENVAFKVSEHINWKSFWKQTLIKFLVIAAITTLFVYYTNKSFLFHVIINKPLFWIFILLIYTFLSVYPQELIYRTFYFKRYQTFFKNKYVLILSNALIFSLAHVFFGNQLVLALTFLGGILFAMTYYRTQSTLLVSIEHAIYGCWLFSVGMGDMLGFPA
jgi:membrane protease YdiL (CAAX protease family)